MSSWWVHLSWAHVTMLALVVLLASTALGLLIANACSINQPRQAPRRSWSTRDYSKEYQEKVDWLGDDFLCAKPVNRRVAR